MLAGGDRLEYDGDTGSLAASLIKTKLLINCVVVSEAKKGARFVSCDLSYLFLVTLMYKLEYNRINYKYIPEEIRE